MPSNKFGRFLLHAAAAGLLAAIVIALFFPQLLDDSRQSVVEVRQTDRPASTQTLSGPVSYADAVAQATPSVVNIYTRKTVVQQGHPLMDDPFFRFFFGDRFGTPQSRVQSSLGSGVIISPQGYLLTNNHVIEDADEIEALLADGRSLPARVVGTDPETDLAVLKIEAADLPAIVVGDSGALRVGDVVLAIGNPFGVGQTVTLGIVSATGRSRLGINTFEDFIQTDAAINPGNSGGALINAFGELVGINTAIFTRSGGSQGIGFAIPVDLARGVMTQIIEKGQVVRGWLGIEVQEITPQLAEGFGLSETRGVLVAGVGRGTPAARAGLRPGDVLTELDGEELKDARDVLNLIARHTPGEMLTIRGVREGRPLELQAEVGQRPTPQRQR